MTPLNNPVFSPDHPNAGAWVLTIAFKFVNHRRRFSAESGMKLLLIGLAEFERRKTP
jgi:hypothetical protein